jgi:hypothetical protein
VRTWDLLIPTIPHRHEKLCALLKELDRQHEPGFAVRICRDNLERRGIMSYLKWQDLVESSTADYVSWAGDDDWISPDFVPLIMEAIQRGPDQVGFPVKFTHDHIAQPHVMQSLRYSGWYDWPEVLRDICHLNPLKRELALLGRWRGIYPDEDARWAAEIRATRKVRTEVWINQWMYHYQRVSGENFWAPRVPMPVEDIQPLPTYPWLTVIEDTR